MAGLAQAQIVKIPISKVIQTRDGKKFYVHTVQKGQTVYSIAKAYKVSMDDIYYNNPSARTGIMVGQKLFIPVVSKETEIRKQVKNKTFDFFYHVASAGETIDHIASIYLIPKKYILLANPGLKGPLKEGEFVKIPVQDAYKILDQEAKGHTTGQNYSTGLNTTNTANNNLPVEKVINQMEKEPAPKVNTTSKQKQQPQNTVSKIPIIKNYRHITMQGETLKSIARKYKISVAELKAVNPGVTYLVRGMQLKLPVNAKVPGYHPSKAELQQAKAAFQNTSTPNRKSMTLRPQQKQTKPGTKYIVHIVKPKETLYSISRTYGVNLNDIYKANKNLTTIIRPGQKILIPKKKINKNYVVYSPISKIRLKKVAKLYGISYSKIKQKNPSLGRKVFPGQVVMIPVEKKPLITPWAPPRGKQKPEKTEIKTSKGPLAPRVLGCTPAIHHKTFKVALMVPLYLEQTDNIDIQQFMMKQERHFEPFRFVQFLEGALLASESLKSQGMNVKLYVYDVDQTLTKTSKVLSRPELPDMNLIIGPFYSGSFNEVSLFAGHFHIPIVNPLTFRESVLNGPGGIIKVKPGFSFEPALVQKLIKQYYSKDKVFLLTPSTFENTEIIHAFRDSIQSILPDSVKYANSQLVKLGIAVTQRERLQEQTELLGQLKAQREILLDELQQNQGGDLNLRNQFKQTDSLLHATEKPIVTTLADTLRPYFLENQFIQPDSLKTSRINDTTSFPNTLIQINYMQNSLHPFLDNASVLRNNLVVVYGTNKAFVMDVMNRLNVLADTFNVKMIGVPAWETISNLNDYQMSNLQTIYPSSYYVNYNAPAVRQFDSLFLKNYGTVPRKYGFLGYDITHYFLDALYHYGESMTKCLPDDSQYGLSTRFQFVPSSQNNKNYENKYWNILQIKNMHLNKLPDSTNTYFPFPWPQNIQIQDTIQ